MSMYKLSNNVWVWEEDLFLPPGDLQMNWRGLGPLGLMNLTHEMVVQLGYHANNDQTFEIDTLMIEPNGNKQVTPDDANPEIAYEKIRLVKYQDFKL